MLLLMVISNRNIVALSSGKLRIIIVHIESDHLAAQVFLDTVVVGFVLGLVCSDDRGTSLIRLKLACGSVWGL